MRRNIAEILFPVNEEVGYERGDELAHRAAVALADRFDAPTIIAVTDALSFIDRVGGQLYITTARRKVNLDGQMVGKDEEGEFRSFGLTFVYESRDAALTKGPARPPETAFGVEVRDTSEPPTEVEVMDVGDIIAEPPLDEKTIRDEIEAEVRANEERSDPGPAAS